MKISKKKNPVDTRHKAQSKEEVHLATMMTMRSLCCLFSVFLLLQSTTEAASRLDELEYRVYPRRTAEEASKYSRGDPGFCQTRALSDCSLYVACSSTAVLEWGHSAIISALDASVAYFGPQTSQAALLEVECQPVLASPLNGVNKEGEATSPLDNADEVLGNMVVMTNTGGLSGLDMAKIAMASGAAALLVVNIDEDHPDDIYRLEATEDDAEEVDIPVVMISLNSANVLTTATVTPDMAPSDIVNHGMPDRVRLYAGGDRPFFEDVEPVDPTLYLIHNLLTEEEAQHLVQSASTKVEPVTRDSILELSHQTENLSNVERVMLWKGALQPHSGKQVEERIEQVTGFPAAHYSDFVVDRLDTGSFWKPHFDAYPPNMVPTATITVFLTDDGPPIVYPSCREPIKIMPRKGMAIVHHNTDEKFEVDMAALHAFLPPTSEGPVYVARKYVFPTPVSNARRICLPLLAAPFGGKLPKFAVKIHDALVSKFGEEQGGVYFDKLCVFVPLLLLILLAQFIGNAVQSKMKQQPTKKKEKGKKD